MRTNSMRTTSITKDRHKENELIGLKIFFLEDIRSMECMCVSLTFFAFTCNTTDGQISRKRMKTVRQSAFLFRAFYRQF